MQSRDCPSSSDVPPDPPESGAWPSPGARRRAELLFRANARATDRRWEGERGDRDLGTTGERSLLRDAGVPGRDVSRRRGTVRICRSSAVKETSSDGTQVGTELGGLVKRCQKEKDFFGRR